MEIKKIYFDMDGVLADFTRGIREVCGMEPLDQKKATPAQDAQMWDAVRRAGHFYDLLEPMPGAIDMFRELYAKYGDRCEILTGIPKAKRGIMTAGDDKVCWAHRLLAEDLKVNIVYREDKKDYCTGPECILIDDLEKNIEEWKAMGGSGIRFTDASDVLRQVRELEKL